MVIPSESPTVPKAETVSNRLARKLWFSKVKIIKNTTDIVIAERNIIDKAFRVFSFDMVLFAKFALSFERSVFQVRSNIKLNVDVLIPPPVDPGEAPIYIRMISKNNVEERK